MTGSGSDARVRDGGDLTRNAPLCGDTTRQPFTRCDRADEGGAGFVVGSVVGLVFMVVTAGPFEEVADQDRGEDAEIVQRSRSQAEHRREGDITEHTLREHRETGTRECPLQAVEDGEQDHENTVRHRADAPHRLAKTTPGRFGPSQAPAIEFSLIKASSFG
ncbi:hypothetical protein [Streptomyces shenzhenensis]|uniref:hypothetical protein n=1 Tax=Streptomyces shenzhenensis TaxID=943815 RepID=UPI003407E8CD